LIISTNRNQTSAAAAVRSPPPQSGASPELSATQINASTNKTCMLTHTLANLMGTPQQTEGPYFVDGMPNRSDIRSDPSDGSVQEGIPLRLAFHVYNVDSGSRIPLNGARVDIWHANLQGIHSDVNDFGTTGKKFLRAYQVTDYKGTTQFTTIYPGWYQDRTIHAHVNVRTFEGSNKTLEWTTQFYFDNSVNKQVHTQPPYNKHGPPSTTNEQVPNLSIPMRS
jgi:protocatechuate 3,4-dioxygenase beta subunit